MAGPRSSPNAKRVQPGKKTERQGIALIGKVVADMGHLWNEPQNDFGTDGSIELVDPATEKATNRIVLVQSKATAVAFGDRPVGFTCDEDDLRYWLHGNAPVILVRSHPAGDEAYWVSVKDYFHDHPEQRATRRVLFAREHDRFDAAANEALTALARPRVDGLHLGTPPIHETLISNLLPVDTVPATIYTAKATISRSRDAHAIWGDTPGEWPKDWIVWAGQIYSFSDPAAGLLSKLCTGPVTSFATSDWADADDEDLRHHYVWLLKAALTRQMRPALRFGKDLAWIAATKDLPFVVPIKATSTTRTLVKTYSRPDGAVRYVRHLGFAPTFVRYDDQWFLELTPTYHYTRDGITPDFYAGSHRAAIKRIERHQDFRRNVDTLARLLRGEVDLGGLTPDPEHQLLEFGELAGVRLDTGTDDELGDADDLELDDADELDDRDDDDSAEERDDDRSAA